MARTCWYRVGAIMETLDEKGLISLIKEEYVGRLSAIGRALRLLEVKVFNERGDLLLSKGLKVRHKSSGYEYTVDHVEGEGDAAIVFLRHPDVPRFQPPDSGEPLNEQDDEAPVEDLPPVMAQKSDEQVGMLRVSLKDFEKEYEVE